MANELIINSENAIALASQYDISELLKPLKQEIHLFDTFVAGTMHLTDDTPLKEMKEGDMLALRREQNKFDDNAILILDMKGRKIGYIPEKDNIIFARLMDAGKLLNARISSVRFKGTVPVIAIGIYMTDY